MAVKAGVLQGQGHTRLDKSRRGTPVFCEVRGGGSWWPACIQNETWFSLMVFANAVFTEGLGLLRQRHEGGECLELLTRVSSLCLMQVQQK